MKVGISEPKIFRHVILVVMIASCRGGVNPKKKLQHLHLGKLL